MLQFEIVRLGFRSLMLHKLRSLLTILGVVFGVGSVVSLLAIGEGVSHDMEEQLLRLGPDRILIRSKQPPHLANSAGDVLTYGMSELDFVRIERLIPHIASCAKTFEMAKEFWNGQHVAELRIVGTTPEFRDVHRLEVAQGRFLAWTDIHRSANVAVVGAGVARKLWGAGNPIGQTVWHSSGHYTIIGVLKPRSEQGTLQHDPNQSLFLPFSTAKTRFENIVRVEEQGGKRYERLEIHQIGLRVQNPDELPQIAGMIRSLLVRYHPRADYELVVPYELLEQTERTKRIFNAVLGSIGGISLLVGGIGIMNIMLATVTERTREIGIRRALGATRRHIVLQFLIESVVLSSIGGFLGLGLGVAVPLLVTQLSEVKTIVTPGSMLLSFGISVGVGIVFGVYPARKAAQMEPVAALRMG